MSAADALKVPPNKGRATKSVMRKITVYIATSADGYIARPDGRVDWLNRPMPKGGYGMTAFARSIDTILWGRKTYDFAAKMGGVSAYGKVKHYALRIWLSTAGKPV